MRQDISNMYSWPLFSLQLHNVSGVKDTSDWGVSNVVCVSTQQQGGSGGIPPKQENFQIKCSEIASEAIFGQNSYWNSSFSTAITYWQLEKSTLSVKITFHVILVAVNFQVYTQDTRRYIE